MPTQRLILILADQLSPELATLRDADPERDTIVMAEVAEEAHYVRHNRHKIALLFSAMRHFSEALERQGFRVIYRRLADGVATLEAALRDALKLSGAGEVLICAPGEYRLWSEMQQWSERFGVPVTLLEDDRFLASHEDFANWAQGRKQLRMEYFYRQMRTRYNLLMDGVEPCGGRWNYDSENRIGWRAQVEVPERPRPELDALTEAVILEVMDAFPTHPGDLSQFAWAVTREQAQSQFEWFLTDALPSFGRYQDALAEESRLLFHSLISAYINCGLLEPLAVCQQVEAVYRAGGCDLSAAEGFIRQIIGWREYVRGIYWLLMPDYAKGNALATDRPLPEFFWNGETQMRCLSEALRHSLDHGYAHHIERLMVIGNFALLAGLDVTAVCDWFLGVYVDAYEWVELPNTLGMALYGDGGVLASKPYAASGKYIQKQGNHCRQCRYDPKLVTGDTACPYNSLYWHFINRHQAALSQNPRMGLIMGQWRKRAADDRDAVVAWGDQLLSRIESL